MSLRFQQLGLPRLARQHVVSVRSGLERQTQRNEAPEDRFPSIRVKNACPFRQDLTKLHVLFDGTVGHVERQVPVGGRLSSEFSVQVKFNSRR
jgi:hypothetical protein